LSNGAAIFSFNFKVLGFGARIASWYPPMRGPQAIIAFLAFLLTNAINCPQAGEIIPAGNPSNIAVTNPAQVFDETFFSLTVSHAVLHTPYGEQPEVLRLGETITAQRL
jgi:hypothetical protein